MPDALTATFLGFLGGLNLLIGIGRHSWVGIVIGLVCLTVTGIYVSSVMRRA